MIDSTIMAGILGVYLALFFSVHGYMDLRMIRKKKTREEGERLDIPLRVKTAVVIPSLLFWVLFLVSPFLVYSGLYRKLASDMLSGEEYAVYIQTAGLILLLLGVLLADWGRISRGVIAPSASMPEDYKLSTTGAYALVRHPMYVSYGLFFLGLPLVFLNVYLFWLLIGVPGYYRVAQEEERGLKNRFGKEYENYQKEVGMFWPKF